MCADLSILFTGRDLWKACLEFERRNQLDLAIRACFECIRQVRGNDEKTLEDAEYKAVNLLMRRGRKQIALRMAQSLVARRPSSPRALYVLATVHHRCAEFTQALQCYKDAVRVSPQAIVYREVLFKFVSDLMSTPALLPLLPPEIQHAASASEAWKHICTELGISPQPQQRLTHSARL